LLFYDVIDRLMEVVEEAQFAEIVVEVAFAFSNITAGTAEQISSFIDHPTAWDFVVTKMLYCHRTMP
jgi:hypothetical protein